MRPILLITMLLSSISAHAGERLNCSTDQAAWTSVQLWGDPNEMLFIIKNTVENRKKDIGAIAHLRFIKTAKHDGMTFHNYRGYFEGGTPHKTLSIWLSSDNRTMTHLIGEGVEYDCYYDYD